jgi:hypothetical protein
MTVSVAAKIIVARAEGHEIDIDQPIGGGFAVNIAKLPELLRKA